MNIQNKLIKFKQKSKGKRRKPPPPFGTTQPRFQTHGLPIQESYTSKYVNLGPATYDVNQALKKKAKSIPNWNVQLKNEIIQGQKKKVILGPATHNIPNFIEDLLKKSHNYKMDLGFGTSPRMKEAETKFVIPAPNLYDTRDVESKLDVWRSTKPTFDRDNRMQRFKTRTYLVPWSLPSTRYGFYKNINAPMVAEITDRKISLRGPYDVSSGPRFPSVKDETVNWPGKLPDFFEEFKNPRRANYGKWRPLENESKYTGSRLERKQMKSSPEDPGPGHYCFQRFPFKIPESKIEVPFMSSVKECRPFCRPKIFPGPGRYNHIRRSKYSIRYSYKSVFKSKTKRQGFIPQEEYLAW